MTAARLRLAAIALSLAVFLLAPGQARAGIATIPMGEYFGTVTVNGQAAPAGSTVQAVSPSGAPCGSGSVTSHGGSYSLLIEGSGDCSDVSFLINGRPADQQAEPWHLGTRAARLDLTVTGQTSPATPGAGAALPAASPGNASSLGSPSPATSHVDLTFTLDPETQPAPATTSASAPAGKIVSFSPGWDLVAGPPGTVLADASGPAYTFQANDTDYEQTPAGSPLQAGHGYWAQFSGPATVWLPVSDDASLTLDVPEDQFVLIGNPFDVPAAVSGASALYIYDPAAGYQPATTLQPGQGAWATSVDGTILLSAAGG